MDEPLHKCPECHAYYWPHSNPLLIHSPDCKQNTPEMLLAHIAEYQKGIERASRHSQDCHTQAQLWQGKFHSLRLENNALRKKVWQLSQTKAVKPRFSAPSIEQCVAWARDAGLDPSEGEKFFHFYESKGWKVGKTPMKSAASAFAGWVVRNKWKDGSIGDRTPANLILWQNELARIEARMKAIKDNAAHDAWGAHLTEAEKKELNALKARAAELRVKLGFKV